MVRSTCKRTGSYFVLGCRGKCIYFDIVVYICFVELVVWDVHQDICFFLCFYQSSNSCIQVFGGFIYACLVFLCFQGTLRVLQSYLQCFPAVCGVICFFQCFCTLNCFFQRSCVDFLYRISFYFKSNADRRVFSALIRNGQCVCSFFHIFQDQFFAFYDGSSTIYRVFCVKAFRKSQTGNCGCHTGFSVLQFRICYSNCTGIEFYRYIQAFLTAYRNLINTLSCVISHFVDMLSHHCFVMFR